MGENNFGGVAPSIDFSDCSSDNMFVFTEFAELSDAEIAEAMDQLVAA